MRGAADCTRKLKSLVNSLKQKGGRVPPPPLGDPVMQLVLGVLTRDAPEARALEAMEKMRTAVVDFNELRVIPPIELAEWLGDFSDSRLKAEDISRALNHIFAIEHTVSLERASEMPPRDALTYLQKVDGLDPYVVARIRLLGFRHPAFPLDEAMWAYARQVGAVHAKAPLDECQQFLERHIPADDAVEIFALLRKAAWAELAGAVRKRQVERITSTPPDRTSRNMLQAIQSGQLDAPEGLPLELAIDPDAEAVEPAAERKKSARAASRPRPAAAAAAADKPKRRAAKAKPAVKARSASGGAKRKAASKPAARRSARKSK